MINLDIHGFKNQHDSMLFSNRSCFFKPLDDIFMHLFLTYIFNVITPDHSHHLAIQLFRCFAGSFDFFQELRVIFRIVQTGSKTPSSKLGNGNVMLLASFNHSRNVLIAPRPELHSFKTKCSSILEPFGKLFLLGPPHFNIHCKLSVLGLARKWICCIRYPS